MNLIVRHMRFIKFGLVAAGYNFIAYVTYVSLLYIKCNYLLASTISFMLGVILSYFMNKTLVFAARHHNYNLVIRYIVFYFILLGINLLMLYFMTQYLVISPYVAQILVTMIAALISYNSMRVFVFRKK